MPADIVTKRLAEPRESVETSKVPSLLSLAFTAAMVAFLLTLNTLITRGVNWPINWGRFSYRLYRGFDLNSFVIWLLIPFLLSLPTMDWGFFGFRRWRRSDWYLLLALVVVCLLAVLIVPFVPRLTNWYPGLAGEKYSLKWRVTVFELTWIASWLPGWEFMHRYYLLRPFKQRFPRYGWLVVPLSEGLFHLQKHWLEMLGMVAISLVLTQWAARRRNMLLPFLTHLSIEVELVIVRLFY